MVSWGRKQELDQTGLWILLLPTRTQSSAWALGCCWCWSCVGQKGSWPSRVLWGCIHPFFHKLEYEHTISQPWHTGGSFCWELLKAVSFRQWFLRIWSYKKVFIWCALTFLFPGLIREQDVSERGVNPFTLKWCENVCTAFRFMLYPISRRDV